MVYEVELETLWPVSAFCFKLLRVDGADDTTQT